MSTAPFEIRMAHLEGAYEQVNERLASIDRRLDGFEQRVESRFTTVEAKIDSALRWLIGTIFGAWITTILAIFFHR